MKKLLIILCLFSTIIKCADISEQLKAAADILAVCQNTILKLELEKLKWLEAQIDDIFNSEVLNDKPDVKFDSIRDRMVELLKKESWYNALNIDGKTEISFLLYDLIDQWMEKHSLIVNKDSKIWKAIKEQTKKMFQPDAYSTKAKLLEDIKNEIFQKIYKNIKNLPDYSELSFDSRIEVIKELKEDICLLSDAFYAVT